MHILDQIKNFDCTQNLNNFVEFLFILYFHKIRFTYIYFYLFNYLFKKIFCSLNFFLISYLQYPQNIYLKKQASLRFFFFLYYTIQTYFKKKFKSNFLCYFKEYKNSKKNELLLSYFQKNIRKNFIYKTG